MMCQSDLDQIIFWLRNLPVMVRLPWLNWSLGDFKKWREISGAGAVLDGWCTVCLHVDASFTDGSSRPTARK
jgi:hypothetical protein